MTKYVILKRDLYENPGHRGYTGIRNLAGVWTMDELRGVNVRAGYAPEERDSYAIPLDVAPEFTNECFHDLSIEHLRGKIKQFSLLLSRPVAWHRSAAFCFHFSLGPNKPANNTSSPDEWTPLYAGPRALKETP